MFGNVTCFRDLALVGATNSVPHSSVSALFEGCTLNQLPPLMQLTRLLCHWVVPALTGMAVLPEALRCQDLKAS
jgi:hypothetical protein